MIDFVIKYSQFYRSVLSHTHTYRERDIYIYIYVIYTLLYLNIFMNIKSNST